MTGRFGVEEYLRQELLPILNESFLLARELALRSCSRLSKAMPYPDLSSKSGL